MTAPLTPETNRPVAELLPAQSFDGTHSWHASTWLGRALAVGGALLSVLYLSNIGLGVVELLPDNIPVAGNIDEVLFTMLLVFCLRKLGIDLAPLLGARNRQRNP
jgi:hypothetical protein